MQELREALNLQEKSKHTEISQLRSTGNRYSKVTICDMCDEVIQYTHTKEGVRVWMTTHQELVMKKRYHTLPNHLTQKILPLLICANGVYTL